MEKELKCAGCGVNIQSLDDHLIGYAPEEAIIRDPLICQRCFRIKHYNESSQIILNQDHFVKLLSEIALTKALVVHIIDIFDFEGSMISSLARFVGQNPILLVINKIDLLPKVTNYNRIINWAQRRAKENSLRVVEVIVVSAKKNMGFDRVIQGLQKHKLNQDVYVVGATNVGKSTLINRLIANYSDLQAELTTSMYPGTTLDIVKIPIQDGTYIIDTPGIVFQHRLTELVDKQDVVKLTMDKPLKPVVFQLSDQQTLFFGALVRFDFVKGERQSFTCYTSNAIKIHRTKLERADELYREHRGVLLQPPDEGHIDQLPQLIKHPIHIPKGKLMDVSISGLGWIKVNRDCGADLVVHAPKGVKVVSREAMI
jgi:ribosome biogenesis GTPase YqeH